MRAVLRVILPLVIIAVAIAATVALVKTKPEAKKTPRNDRGVLVEVIEVRAERQQVKVYAHGNVIPARQVMMAPEVGGRVNWIHDKLVPGTRFPAKTKLVKIDARDYSLAVEQQLATVNRAKTELEIEASRGKIAEREWEMFQNRQKAEPAADPLAVREPQLRTARVAVKAARSGLNRARLAVSRTTLSVPFNAMVQNKNVELGQIVAPGAPLVTLVGTDTYWVQVAVPVSRLSWFDIPGVGRAQVGAAVDVEQRVGSQRVRRSGRIIRLLGDVDPAGRMARVLVEIDDPLGLKPPPVSTEVAPNDSPLPLLIGAYVEVAIHGRDAGDLIAIPREALRDGREVFVLADDGTLAVKPVELMWSRRDTVLVSTGLANGDEIIVSPVPAPVAGMKLRTARTVQAEPTKSARATE